MKNFSVFLSVVAALCLFSALADPDWSTLSGSVIVPSEATWTATESDMAYVNALTDITVDGELVFDGCTTCPKANLLKGQGTVRKTGSQEWTYTVDQSNFDGDFRIDEGKITLSGDAVKPFGKTASGCNGAVYVASGATLKIATTKVKFVYRHLHIAGPGCSSAAEDKALCIDTAQSGAIGFLDLDADATLYIRNNSNYYWVGNQGMPLDNNSGVSTINLGNYTLTKTGAMLWHFLGPKFLGGTIVNKEANVNIMGGANFGDGNSGPFAFENAATLNFYNNPSPIKRPLELRDIRLKVGYTSNRSGDSNHPLLRSNCCCWEGPVTLSGANSELNIDGTYVNGSYDLSGLGKANDIQLSFLGNISGSGKVSTGTTSERSGRGRTVLGGHNSYTGETLVRGGISSRLYVYYHDTIPDYSKLTVDRGHVALRLGTELAEDGVTETNRWPLAKIWELRSNATFLDDGAVALDASGCPDGVFEIASSDILASDSRHDVGLGVAGGTFRITSEDGDVLPINPCAYLGTLELTGLGTYSFVGTNALFSVSGNPTNCSRIAIYNGAKVVQGLAPFRIGRKKSFANGSYALPAYGYVSISNATWLTTAPDKPGIDSEYGFDLGAIHVGAMERGVLDIQKDAVVSNKVIAGGGGRSQETDRGEGAVYVNGGAKLFVTAGGAHFHYASSIGYGGYGYLQLDPGAELESAHPFHIGGYGRGVYHQYGGTFKHDGNLNLSACNRGVASVYVAGGSLSAKLMASSMGINTQGYLSIDGADSVVNLAVESLYMNNASTAISRVSLVNGGTLRCWRITPYNMTSTPEHPIILNFDGGRVRRTGGGTFISQRKDLVEFAIYKKGIIYDTETYNSTQDAGVPFVGRVSGGVQSVDASAALSMNWIGAPQVVITGTGGGCGAVAVADWDTKERKLKGVKIVSPGWGYAQGAVSVEIRTRQYSVTISGDDVQVGDNDIGGFTLEGTTGSFTCSETNSWQKWTRIDGGTFKVASNGAIPSGTELVLNGGSLNLGGFDADAERPTTFSGLSGTGGTVVNGAVKVVGEWKISASNLLTQTSTALNGALDLSGVTKFTLVDADALEGDDVPGKVSFFTATSVTWPANIVVEGVPSRWKMAKSHDGRSLRLSREMGFLVIVR